MRTLFLSGYASHVALPENITAEPGAFLQKPFSVDALMAKVRERLARTETGCRQCRSPIERFCWLRTTRTMRN